MSAPQAETLDRLYLDWSQFTSARTGREIRAAASLEALLKEVDDGGIGTVAMQAARRSLYECRFGADTTFAELKAKARP